MAETKTKETTASVEAFLDRVTGEVKRKDCYTILEMMKKATRTKPKMWGPSIVGFGSLHYKYASGHEGDTARIGFSPRKSEITLYLMPGCEALDPLTKKLGKFKTGKACLYIKRLADVDLKVLKTLINEAVRRTPSQ